ncbi:hypothetical protein [Bacillus swezeyi]|uniref:hypothetical protein n=1 Tax=Bacillus swezeyi TaxID=1925020 RepID=UPI0039C5DA7E
MSYEIIKRKTCHTGTAYRIAGDYGPSVHPTPKNQPIAIINEDQGVELPGQGKINVGADIVFQIKNAQQAEESSG